MKTSVALGLKMDGEPDINAEISRELELLQDDDQLFEDDGFVDEDETTPSPDNDISEDEVQEFTLPYLERVQSRTGAFEKCLEECDELLRTIDRKDKERNPDETFMKLAEEQGVEDFEAFKSMVISDNTDQQDEFEKSSSSITIAMETVTNGYVPEILETVESEMDPETKHVNDSLANGIDEITTVNNNNSDESDDVQDKEILNLAELINEKAENEDGKAIDEYQQWMEKWSVKQSQRNVIEEVNKKKETEKLLLVEQKRSEKLKELETQKQEEAQRQQEIEQKLKVEMEKEEKQIKESLEIYQAEIDKLALEIAEEQKNLESKQDEQKKQNEEKQNKNATKIQSLWRGHRVRKEHGDSLKERLAKIKVEKEAAMLKEIEERRKEIERKKEEKRAAEEREKREKTEQVKKEESKKKEAEERRLEEERKKERKEKEEKEKLEKEEREMKEREKEERVEREKEEKERREKEEREKKEREKMEKREKEEKERKDKEEAEKKEREKIEKEKKERQEEEERIRKEEELKKKELEKRKKEEDQRKKMEEEKKKQEEVKKKEEEAIKKKERERKLQLMMTLPKDLETMRLAWMKSCQPWSKSKQELKRRKPSSAKKQLRRPLSAKKLPLIKEDVILSAAQVSSLQQITTVELNDLPGFSSSPLGGCRGLKHLVINNCHLVALEGFEQHASLQYLDLKNNEIEALLLTDVTSLLWLDVSNNRLSSIHGLEGCQNLRHLNLSHNRITRIACTEWLTNLHTLNLSHNQLITTKGLGQMSALQDLNLSSNHLANIEDIAPLSLLACLDASSNNLLQIPVFENQVLLRHLNLRDNSLSSVDEFSIVWLPLLHTLVISNNGLVELSSLGNLISLQNLNVSHNQLIDLESILPGINECRQLIHLILEENPYTEENDYRALLKEHVQSLQQIDGSSVLQKTDADIEEKLTGFELMCRCQNEICEKLKTAYSEVLRNNYAVGEDLLKLHLTFIEEDQRLAEEHRFAHEFGSISSHLDTTLKVDFKDIIKKSSAKSSDKRKASLNSASSVLVAESQMQNASIHNKNKFEEALNKVTPKPPSVPKTQPTRNLNQGSKSSLSSPSKSDKSEKMCDKDDKVESQGQQSSQGQPLRSQGQISRSNNLTTAPGSVSASTVQKILQSENAELKSSHLQNRAATIIQAYWRGHSVRREINRLTIKCLATTVIQSAYRGWKFRQNLIEYLWPRVDHRVLHGSAIKIQALWRGYVLRKRLQQALDFARLESGEDFEDEEFPEIDLEDFNFDEHGLNEGWLPPDTPQLPSSHAVLKGPAPEKPNNKKNYQVGGPAFQEGMSSRIQLFQKVPQAPAVPIYAWEKSDQKYNQANDTSPTVGDKPPLPPLSRFSDASSEVTLPGVDTTRTMNSKRSDKLAEEWGFKDSRTAELMMARAKKLKYNAQRKQKYSQLDPKQKLALYKKLEENSRVKPIQLPPRKSVPRKEYFQARAEELRTEDYRHEQERQQKVSRTYEWLHTQVGGYDSPTGRPVSQQGLTNLPHIDPTNRGRAQLTASPSLELQSVGSESNTDLASYRRHSSASDNGGKLVFPAIKTGSAPLANVKERISFRDTPVKKSGGWGGGKKRGQTNRYKHK